MKPTIKTADIKNGNKEVVVVSPTVERKKKPKTKMYIFGSVLVCLLIMAAVTVSGVYFGLLSHKMHRSYWASYHLDGGQTVNEQITLTDTEEDITVTGTVRVIFDFETALLVMRPSDTNVCFVSQFNMSALPTPKQAMEHCKDKRHIDEVVKDAPTEIHVRVTDIEVNVDMLSLRAREMCSGSRVFWLELLKGEHPAGQREKRRAQPIIMCVISGECYVWQYL